MAEGFRLAIASGKGGTGKTTLATSLALALTRIGESSVTLVDCDVEQPNDTLFIQPGDHHAHTVSVPTPAWRDDLCDGCGLCATACRFGAVAVVRGKRLFFPELCHGCGACWEVCKCGAANRSSRAIGLVFDAPAVDVPSLRLVWGQLDIGQPLAPPVIRKAKRVAAETGSGLEIHDAPPGTACPLIETLRDASFCLLVTEPTPFGLHDLAIAREVVSSLGVPAAVVLNRTGINDAAAVESFCTSHSLPLVMRIPFSGHIAKVLSGGGTLLDADPAWETLLGRVWLDCRRLAGVTLEDAAHGR